MPSETRTSVEHLPRAGITRRNFLGAGIRSAAAAASYSAFSLFSDFADAGEENENGEKKNHPLAFSSENRSHVILNPKLAQDLNQCPAFGIEATLVPRKITQGEVTIIGNHHNSNGVFLRFDGGFLEFGVGMGSSYETVSWSKKIVAGQKIKAGGVVYPRGIQLFVNDIEIEKRSLEKPREAFKFPFMMGADPKENGRDPQHYFNGEIHGARVVVLLPSGKKRKNDKLEWQDAARYELNGKHGNELKDVAEKYGPYNGEIHGARWLTPEH